MPMAAAARAKLPPVTDAARYSRSRISTDPPPFACRPEPEWAGVWRDDSSGGCHADRLFLKQCVKSREMTH